MPYPPSEPWPPSELYPPSQPHPSRERRPSNRSGGSSEVSRLFTVPYPIDVVRGFLVDFSHAPRWDPAIPNRVTLVGDADSMGKKPPRLGSEWTTRSVFDDRHRVGYYRLERGHPHWITIVGRHRGLTRSVEFALVDLGLSCEVHLTVRYAFHGPRGFIHRARYRNRLGRLADQTATALPAAIANDDSIA